MDKKEAILVAKKYLSGVRDFITMEKLFFLAHTFTAHKVRRGIDIRIEPHIYIAGNDQSGFAEEVKKVGIPL